MSHAWSALGGAAVMALLEWLWTRDWSDSEVNSDFLLDPTMENDYADPK